MCFLIKRKRGRPINRQKPRSWERTEERGDDNFDLRGETKRRRVAQADEFRLEEAPNLSGEERRNESNTTICKNLVLREHQEADMHK